MRILIVTDAWSPQVNGVVFTLQQTCLQLEAMGHAVTVLHPALFRSMPCPSYPEIRLAWLPGKRLGELIRTFAPQALHIATEGPLGIAARRHALRCGMPFTTAYHTRFPEYLHARTRIPVAWTYRWLRRFHGSATRTMVPTPSVRADLVARGFDPDRVVVWSRGVDPQVFHPGSPDADADSPGMALPVSTPATHRDVASGDAPAAAAPAPIFLYAGRVAVEKNIEAFLRTELPGRKQVIGDGPALPDLKRRYPDAEFLGAMPHARLAAHYRKADVFVFPSQTDTFGLVLLEAMACGCPVAALPSPATRDVLGDSGAGVIDANLGQACLRALSIPRRIPAAHAARFSWQSTSETFLEYLQPILQKKK